MSKRLLFAALLVVFATGCGRAKTSRVLVLGLDGMDPQTVDLLMSEGKLPNFAKMRQSGAYSPLQSQEPLLSPVIWTTIATGKTPDQHRIGHFVAVNPETGGQMPATSQMRKVKALWNILSDKGRTVDVVGWWATWPAESVKGSIVSDHFAYHFLFEEGLTGDPNATGKTFPADLAQKLKPDVKRPQDLTMADVKPFIDVTPEEFAKPFDLQDDLSEFKWALSSAITYKTVGLDLWKKENPKNLFVYIEATDSTAHLFGHLFRAQPLAGELLEQQKRYGHAAEAMYVFADQILGEYMKAMDKETTLIVLSDHGFDLGQLPDDPSKLRNMRRVSERFHKPKGILYLYGNRVREHTRIDSPSIVDIAPTILALNGVAPARDMPGRILTEALDVDVPARVASYESGGAAASSNATAVAGDSRVDPEVMKRLQSLGYLHPNSPTGDRNIAAILFEQGKYAEAAAAYAKLVKDKPDDSGLHASLSGALGALGRYDQAAVEATKAIELDPLNAEAYHNRAVIHERKGERDAAIADYRLALKANPSYQATRQALARLGVATETGPTARSASETQALALADQASVSARRGDYKTALAQLDQASKLAPTLAVVWQYRSNVAFLMGDTPGAIAALRKGLEIEPGNLLFQENLKRLEQSKKR